VLTVRMALHSEVSRLSKYLSTLSKPHSSFTTGMTAGTSRSKWDGEGPNPGQCCGSFLAALIASLVAHCTEAARSNGGSPDAGAGRTGRRVAAGDGIGNGGR